MTHQRFGAPGGALRQVALLLTIVGGAVVAILLISGKGKATMSSPAMPEEVGIAVPPIDLEAPQETMTATFAMG